MLLILLPEFAVDEGEKLTHHGTKFKSFGDGKSYLAENVF